MRINAFMYKHANVLYSHMHVKYPLPLYQVIFIASSATHPSWYYFIWQLQCMGDAGRMARQAAPSINNPPPLPTHPRLPLSISQLPGSCRAWLEPEFCPIHHPYQGKSGCTEKERGREGEEEEKKKEKKRWRPQCRNWKKSVLLNE